MFQKFQWSSEKQKQKQNKAKQDKTSQTQKVLFIMNWTATSLKGLPEIGQGYTLSISLSLSVVQRAVGDISGYPTEG